MKNRSETKNPRQSYMIRKHVRSEQKVKQEKDPIVFMLIDDSCIGLHLPYSLSNETIKSLVKQNGGVWEPNFKIWKIPKATLTAVRSEVPRILPECDIEDIPLFIDRALKPMPERLRINQTNEMIAYDPLDRRIQAKDNPLYHKLYQFQKASLELAIKNFGRLLIADQMGIGKTLQSLACAFAYESDWPLLIICPSALKHVWREEVKKWMKDRIKNEYIQVVEKYGTVLDFTVLRIAIFSYEIAAKSVEYLSKFKVVIADQAHYLKNNTAKRTECLVPFLTSRKRLFLLSGTPALAKPRQIYTLVSMIRPDIFYNLKQFGDRYCVLQRNKWTYKLEYEGCRNSAELHYLLKNKIMIRRLKDEVLHELPEKQRQIIEVETCKSTVKQIKQLMNSQQIPLEVLRNNDKLTQFGQTSEGCALTRCYQLTGLAKLQSVKNYLSSLLENDVKILIFAHHQVVMDEIEDHLQKSKVEYMRIDGNTSNQTRRKNVKNFQETNAVRAALLSITAAGVGITLTAASTVVFAQLHWTPANLIQAEDRAHRIGQQSCVNVHYLVGQNTIDSILLNQLQKKLSTTGDILNGNKQKLDAENIKKGSIGRWSAKLQIGPKSHLRNQRSILEYARSQKGNTKPEQSDSDIDEEQIPQDQIEKLIRQSEMQMREKNKLKVLCGIKGGQK